MEKLQQVVGKEGIEAIERRFLSPTMASPVDYRNLKMFLEGFDDETLQKMSEKDREFFRGLILRASCFSADDLPDFDLTPAQSRFFDDLHMKSDEICRMVWATSDLLMWKKICAELLKIHENRMNELGARSLPERS